MSHGGKEDNSASRKGVIDEESRGMCMRGSNASKGEEGESEFQVERDQSQLG